MLMFSSPLIPDFRISFRTSREEKLRGTSELMVTWKIAVQVNVDRYSTVSVDSESFSLMIVKSVSIRR